jgi:hypothetical protein
MPGSLAIDLNMQGKESSSETKATIGQGAININNQTANQDQLNNLNRDITLIEQNKRDVITSDFDATIKIDLRLIAAAGNLIMGDTASAGANWQSYAGDAAKGVNITSDIVFGTNSSDQNPQVTESGTTSKDAVPLTPVWASRLIDENNNEIDPDTGNPIPHPAPNLLTGLWSDNPSQPKERPSVGFADPSCRSNYLSCGMWISDKAPHLQVLHYGIPGFKSFSQFHDAATTNPDGTEKSGAYKFISIFPYIPANYYGAIGTILDSKNWNQNSSRNDNNSNPIFRYDKKNE